MADAQIPLLVCVRRADKAVPNGDAVEDSCLACGAGVWRRRNNAALVAAGAKVMCQQCAKLAVSLASAAGEEVVVRPAAFGRELLDRGEPLGP